MKSFKSILALMLLISPVLHGQEESYTNVSDGPQLRFWSRWESQRLYNLAGFQIDIGALEAMRRMSIAGGGPASLDAGPSRLYQGRWESPLPRLEAEMLKLVQSHFGDLFQTLNQMSPDDIFTVLAILSPRADAISDFARRSSPEAEMKRLHERLAGRAGFISTVQDDEENRERMAYEAVRNIHTLSLYSNLWIISQKMKPEALEKAILEQQEKDSKLGPDRMKIRDYSRMGIPFLSHEKETKELLEKISGNFGRLSVLSTEAKAEIIIKAKKARIPLLKSDKKLIEILKETPR